MRFLWFTLHAVPTQRFRSALVLRDTAAWCEDCVQPATQPQRPSCIQLTCGPVRNNGTLCAFHSTCTAIANKPSLGGNSLPPSIPTRHFGEGGFRNLYIWRQPGLSCNLLCFLQSGMTAQSLYQLRLGMSAARRSRAACHRNGNTPRKGRLRCIRRRTLLPVHAAPAPTAEPWQAGQSRKSMQVLRIKCERICTLRPRASTLQMPPVHLRQRYSAAPSACAVHGSC